jgi:hypothetical protein
MKEVKQRKNLEKEKVEGKREWKEADRWKPN